MEDQQEKPRRNFLNLNWAKKIYEGQYKKLMIVPIILLILAFAQIGFQASTQGEFITKGVSLKGGITITFPEKIADTAALEESLKEKISGDVSIRRITQTQGFIIDTSDIELDELLGFLGAELGDFDKDDYTVEQIGSALGSSFFREIIVALIIAFFFMGIVVFITFRTLVPSLAVMLAALSDIVVTIAIFNLTGMKLTTGGIAAFLMIIGYSVDTDILLTTRVLKRKEGTIMERIYSAMNPGFTMTLTTLAAVLAALFITSSETIRQIMTILLIGLLVDIINTWLQNAGILRWHLEKKNEGST